MAHGAGPLDGNNRPEFDTLDEKGTRKTPGTQA